MPPRRAALPPPDPLAAEHSARLHALVVQTVRAEGGWIPFDRYMELALYAPGLGYYAAGARKFGDSAAGGDFVTEGGGVARGPAGLPMRGLHLPPHRDPQRHDQHQEHRPAPSPQGPPPHAWRHCRCAANTALGYSARPRLPL